jgi:glycosyltransferase involved in cell wall biosynthesis
MKILIVSHQYYPVLGGVPVVARLLSKGFQELGKSVRLITATESCTEDVDPFQVYRKPGIFRSLKLYKWADVVVMIGPSLRSGWPMLILNKPCLISHQAGITEGKLHSLLIKNSKNVACSEYLANQMRGRAISIPNPFDSSLFKINTDILKERDFIYVGRLVDEKGVDVFLNALSYLKKHGITASATIVGAGDDENKLKALHKSLGLSDAVCFSGPLFGDELLEAIQKHRIGIVPSRFQEPYGIVSLELIASGLPVIASRVGGLPESVGPCGVLFDNENYEELARHMENLLRDDKSMNGLTEPCMKHLNRTLPLNVARAYLEYSADNDASR